MKRLLGGVGILLVLVAVSGAPAGGRAPAGTWVGTYLLGGPDALALTLKGDRVLVALGPGHAELQSVPLATSGARLTFALPGRPAALVFVGEIAGGRLRGTVSQGSLRGTFAARPGTAAGLEARGLYGGVAGTQAVVDDPYGPARLVYLESGRVRALYPSGSSFVIGSGFATRSPASGKARFGAVDARIDGRAAKRQVVRQFEVRFKSGPVTLAGTLSLPREQASAPRSPSSTAPGERSEPTFPISPPSS